MTPDRPSEKEGGSRVAFYTLFLFAFFSPFFYIPINGFAISFSDIMAPMCVISILANWRKFINNIFIIYFAFVLTATLGTFVSMGTFGTLNAGLCIRLLFIAMPFFLAFCVSSKSNSQLLTVLKAFFVGTFINVSAGLVLHIFDIKIKDTTQTLWLGYDLGTTARAGGLVGNSGDFAQSAVLLSIFAFSLFQLGEVSKSRLTLGLTLSVAAVYYSNSRAGVLMFLIFFGFFIVLNARQYLVPICILTLSSLVALMIFPSIDIESLHPEFRVPLLRLDVFNLSGNSAFYETVRLDNWGSLTRQFFAIPVMGVGYKNSLEEYGLLIDNSFLLVWFESGVLASAFFIVFWLALLWKVFRATFFEKSVYSSLAFAVFLTFMFRNLTGGAITNWSAAPAFFFLLGGLVVMSKHNHGKSAAFKKPDDGIVDRPVVEGFCLPK
jgi:hypothetical protein